MSLQPREREREREREENREGECEAVDPQSRPRSGSQTLAVVCQVLLRGAVVDAPAVLCF